MIALIIYLALGVINTTLLEVMTSVYEEFTGPEKFFAKFNDILAWPVIWLNFLYFSYVEDDDE